MEKIIALYAASNRGKTTTLKILIELLALVSEYYCVWEGSDAWGRFVINGKKVSVCTSGDTGDIVKENIENYKDCDIFISASRTKGGTVNEIERLAEEESVEIDWIKKDNDESKNKLLAADLFRKVLDLVYPAE